MGKLRTHALQAYQDIDSARAKSKALVNILMNKKIKSCRMQRKSVLQPAIWASCS